MRNLKEMNRNELTCKVREEGNVEAHCGLCSKCHKKTLASIQDMYSVVIMITREANI